MAKVIAEGEAGATATATASRAGSTRILILIFLAAVIEGFDLQAAGVAVPLLAPAFQLGPGQIGLFFSMGTFGLLFGAIAGGLLADGLGRRLALVLSLATFGLFSLVTALAGSFESLLVLRFLTGLGLGGALPVLVSIAAEAAPPERRGFAVAMMYAGVPFGGGLASLVAFADLHGAWQMIFIVGGILPLLLTVPLMMMLPPLRVQKSDVALPKITVRDLFGAGSGVTTLLLWLGFFCGLLMVYILINWLPTLMVQRGLTRPDSAFVMLFFSFGGAFGSLIGGKLLDGSGRRLKAAGCFGFFILSIAGLALLPAGVWTMTLLATLLAIGLIAIQSMLYGIAPQAYGPTLRATGVGLAIAAGRCGSIAGPALAGGLMQAGRSPNDVLMALIPVALVCAIAVIALLLRPMADLRTGVA